jgi:putative holliday junction resolvase
MSSTVEKKPRRILAIDYGRKRIGLALADELGLTARPLATIARANRRNDFRRLRETCMKHGVTHIVVGHPLNMSGDAGEMAQEAARFAARLRKDLSQMAIEVELADERLTTWEARQMTAGSKPGSPRGRSLDELAAAVLLRDYLERQRDLARAAAAEGGD